MGKTKLISALFTLLFIFSAFTLDFVSYWTIKLNQEIVYDSREVEDYSRWDYHNMIIDSISHFDTLELSYSRCPMTPNSIEVFLLINPKNKKIEKEFKFLGTARLTITTADLFDQVDLKEIDIYHFQHYNEEAMRILKIERK